MATETLSTEDVIVLMDARFQSANSIPVDRATIKAHEWAALKDEITKLRAFADQFPDDPDLDSTDEEEREDESRNDDPETGAR